MKLAGASAVAREILLHAKGRSTVSQELEDLIKIALTAPKLQRDHHTDEWKR